MQNEVEMLSRGIKNNSGGTMAIGFVILLVGILAIGSPLVTGASITIMIGAVLLLAGIAKGLYAQKTRQGQSAYVIAGIIIVAGLVMMFQTNIAMATMSILLAVYFFISAAFETLVAFQLRPERSGYIIMFNGFVSLLFCLIVFLFSPLSEVWVIGLFIGIQLIIFGLSLLALVFSARKYEN